MSKRTLSPAPTRNAEHPDANLYRLLADWRDAERANSRLYAELSDGEGDLVSPSRSAELSLRPGDLKLWGLSPPGNGVYDEAWTEMMAPSIERARASQDAPHCLAAVARFDEIARAIGDWRAREEAARAGSSLPELERASHSANAVAIDFRKRVIATLARTDAGLIAKIAAVVAELGDEHLDDEAAEILAQSDVTIDDVLLSAVRDCARVATRNKGSQDHA